MGAMFREGDYAKQVEVPVLQGFVEDDRYQTSNKQATERVVRSVG
jgi:hypothetical protein